jgi:hypothetical protein
MRLVDAAAAVPVAVAVVVDSSDSGWPFAVDSLSLPLSSVDRREQIYRSDELIYKICKTVRFSS